jgi:hypothetical protein
MSLLAKVFVVIQTVLIMVYLGVSATLYQHRRDWRNSYAKLKERYKVSTQLAAKEIEALRNGIKSKDSFISSKQQEVVSLKQELDKQNIDFATAKQQLNKAEDNFQRQMRLTEESTAAKTQSETALAKERDLTRELQTNLDTATRRREIAEGQVARLTQLKTSLEKDIGDLRVNYSDARKALKEKETVLAMLQEKGIDVLNIVAGPPVPAIDARVAAVKNDVSPALVLLSVGSDDKVEKGFHFSVYRGSEFVGKVIVEKVLRDSCGCRVLFTKDGSSIQAGDSAATRLQ